MQFTNNNYYVAADQFSPDSEVIEPILFESPEETDEHLNFTGQEIGTTTNPMMNQVQAVEAKIREGAGKLEIGFMGAGKGNSQQPTPESFGKLERQDIKELLTINDIKSSVHAAVHTMSLAGFGQRGFSAQQREEAINEINRAIDFAGDVTKGGAIVFHLHEWQRPLIDAGKSFSDRFKDKYDFKGYDSEDRDSQYLVVDKRTGQFIEGITRDQKVYEPLYHTAKTFCPDRIGKKDANGVVIKPDDWVDINGNVIPKSAPVDRLFERVPVWNSDHTNFEVAERDWNYFVQRAKEWNEHHPDDKVTPEIIYARTRLENNVLQAKGNSLYHATRYEDHRMNYEKYKEAYEFYKKLEENTPDDRKWELMKQNRVLGDHFGLTIPDNVLPSEWLKKQMKAEADQMRYIHEASASADAQARQYTELMKQLAPVEDYGLQKTAETIAEVGIRAMYETKKKKLENPLFVAPENFDQHMYGSHPDEMKKVIAKSREEMAKRLQQQGYSPDDAKKLALTHISGTLDIGHMNMWRRFYNPVDENGNPKFKTPEEREKAFEKWMLDKAEELVKDGYVKHIHLTDNFGFGDEHLTPGQGNVPMREFLKRLEKHGINDIIVEAGSYNGPTILYDTLAEFGSPIYGVAKGRAGTPRVNQIRNRHFGYNAPGFFIAGPYAPSQDWQPWSQVPLE